MLDISEDAVKYRRREPFEIASQFHPERPAVVPLRTFISDESNVRLVFRDDGIDSHPGKYGMDVTSMTGQNPAFMLHSMELARTSLIHIMGRVCTLENHNNGYGTTVMLLILIQQLVFNYQL